MYVFRTKVSSVYPTCRRLRVTTHCCSCMHDEQMKWAHDMVLTSMREIFACFEGGSSEVKRERRALIAQTDHSIEVHHVHAHTCCIVRCSLSRRYPHNSGCELKQCTVTKKTFAFGQCTYVHTGAGTTNQTRAIRPRVYPERALLNEGVYLFPAFSGRSYILSVCLPAACRMQCNAMQLSLRNTVKKSLQQLSKAINGDAKTEPQTLFKVSYDTKRTYTHTSR